MANIRREVMDEFTEIQLIRSIQETQDKRACEELIRRYYGVLRQLTKYKIPDHTDIDDIVQEVLIKVVTKIDQLREPSKFREWVQKIVYSHINDYYRTIHPKGNHATVHNIHLSNELLDVYMVTESSENEIMHKLEMSDIYDIILGFPNDNIKPFLLHHLCNLSYVGIAAVTQEKPSTIRGRIARAKSSLSKELFDKTVPEEVRSRLATKLSQIATDGSYVAHHLKADYFQNKVLLDELDSRRIEKTKPIIYFSESFDNLMIISELKKDLSTCIIKVKSREAIPILINRIPPQKNIYCIFLSTEYLNYAKKYIHFTSEIPSISFLATPTSSVAYSGYATGQVIESSLEDTPILSCLFQQDPMLGVMLNKLKQEYGSDEQNYRFFSISDPSKEMIQAYAFFVKVDAHLCELGRYIRFNKSDDNAVKMCIAAGTESLIRQGMYISNTGVTENDTCFLDIAPLIGFRESYRFISGIAQRI